MKSKKTGAIVTTVVVAAALVGVSAAFIANASPYVTVSEARKTTSSVYLKGTLLQNSVDNDVRNQLVSFSIKDANGDVARVVYKGPRPNNLDEATEVIAVGSMKGEQFQADRLMLKCPSKYEGSKKPFESAS